MKLDLKNLHTSTIPQTLYKINSPPHSFKDYTNAIRLLREASKTAKVEGLIHSLLGQQDRMSRHTPMIVREKFDELLDQISDLKRQITEEMELLLCFATQNPSSCIGPIRHSMEMIALYQNYQTELMVRYRNLIVDTVDIGVNVARR